MGFLRKRIEYVVRREEADDKALKDLKIHCVGSERGNLKGDLVETVGWV